MSESVGSWLVCGSSIAWSCPLGIPATWRPTWPPPPTRLPWTTWRTLLTVASPGPWSSTGRTSKGWWLRARTQSSRQSGKRKSLRNTNPYHRYVVLFIICRILPGSNYKTRFFCAEHLFFRPCTFLKIWGLGLNWTNIQFLALPGAPPIQATLHLLHVPFIAGSLIEPWYFEAYILIEMWLLIGTREYFE